MRAEAPKHKADHVTHQGAKRSVVQALPQAHKTKKPAHAACDYATHQHPKKKLDAKTMHRSTPMHLVARAENYVPTLIDRRINDQNIRAEMVKQIELNEKNFHKIMWSRPTFWRTIYKIAKVLGESPVYLGGVVYAETTFGIPTSTSKVKGLGQFSKTAWQVVTTSQAYKDAWHKLMGSAPIPEWGTSPTASLVAVAVRHQMDIEKYDLQTSGGRLHHYQESYLCHMLEDNTVWAWLKDVPVAGNSKKTEKVYAQRERTGALFSDPLTEENWVKYKNALQLLDRKLPKGLVELQLALAK